MEHPTSPMRGAPPQDSHSPHSPPPDHRHRGMGDRYRPAPPPSYSAPPGYPHYPPYGGPPQSPYGPPPPNGYTSRGPPPGYPGPPPHHSPPFGYGYPPGPRGSPYHYAGGYDGAYAVPPGRQAVPYRSVGPPRQGPPSQPIPPSQETSSPQKVGGSPSPKSSPSRSPRDANGSSSAPKSTDHIEAERLRAAAAAELTHEEVEPIQSDFHFFVKENVAQFRAIVEEEVRKSLKADEQLDPLLVNSNLNTRLKTAWEHLTNDERDAFMVKEEADRRRFMEEDEVASRHCATLTARGKSPRTPQNPSKHEERQECETVPVTTPDRESSPKIEVEEKAAGEHEDKASTMDETVHAQSGLQIKSETMAVESPQKRSSPPAENEEEKLESPTKRNRRHE